MSENADIGRIEIRERMERFFNHDIARHVKEGSAVDERAMKRSKFQIADGVAVAVMLCDALCVDVASIAIFRNSHCTGHKMLANEVGMLEQGGAKVAKDDTATRQLVREASIVAEGIVLNQDAAEVTPPNERLIFCGQF